MRVLLAQEAGGIQPRQTREIAGYTRSEVIDANAFLGAAAEEDYKRYMDLERIVTELGIAMRNPSQARGQLWPVKYLCDAPLVGGPVLPHLQGYCEQARARHTEVMDLRDQFALLIREEPMNPGYRQMLEQMRARVDDARKKYGSLTAFPVGGAR